MMDDCPHCNEELGYTDIMGDSDWDDQQFEPYETECPKCGKYIIVRQYDIEVVRYIHVRKLEEREVK